MKKSYFLGISLIIFIMLCGISRAESREKLSPRNALLGHWVDSEEKIHYYFRSNKFIVVYQSVKLPYGYQNFRTSTKKLWKGFYDELPKEIERGYHIIGSYGDTLIIKFLYEHAKTRPREITFSHDRKRITMKIKGHGRSRDFERYLTYVDDKQRL